ncbi:hypothetical protein Tco_1325809 [Tanacetum coccineum]
MSSSTITYTSISSDYEEPSDAGSPGVIVYGYDGLPMHLVDPYVEAALQAPEQAPPSLDYVSGPEHPPFPDYPEYPEYLVSSDAEAPIEDQPLPDDVSPTTLSPGYIAGFDPDEDLEDDPKEDPTNYPADGGDDVDDESSDDDDDDEEQEASEEDDEEEEEHSAPAHFSVVPVDDLVPSAEDTKAFETDESAPTPVPSPRRRTARMSIRPQPPMSATIEALIAEFASAPTPPSLPPSPLSPLSSPLPYIPSPLTTSPTYFEAPLGYRAAKIRLRAASPSTSHPSEIPSPPLLLPSTTHKYDLPEADMPLRKRAHFTAPTGRFKVGESSSAAAARHVGHTLDHTVDYGFIDTMDASIRASESRVMTVVGVVNDRVINLATTQRIQAIEAQIRALQRDVDVLQRFRELVRIAEAGPQDGPEDAGSSSILYGMLSIMGDSQLALP